MSAPGNEGEASRGVMERLQRWAAARPDIRAVLLTGSRGSPHGTPDRLSDWDPRLYVDDPRVFLEGRGWASDLGHVLLEMPPLGMPSEAWPWPTRLLLYEDGTKIDFTILPVAALQAGDPDAGLAEGFRAIYDPDGLAAAPSVAPDEPAERGPAPGPASESAFLAVVDEFLWETLYVARHLRRDELFPRRHSAECVLKTDLLRRMLQWHTVGAGGTDARSVGPLGRGLKARLDPGLWDRVESVFVGASVEEGWRGLEASFELFGELGRGVAAASGWSYPEDRHEAVRGQVDAVRAVPSLRLESP